MNKTGNIQDYNDKCALLVNSCDKNSDTWNAFFKMLSVMWPDFDMPVYLTTEKSKYESDLYSVTTVNCDAEWCGRMNSALKMINKDYVILVLDDYILDDIVKTEYISAAIDFLDSRRDVACVHLCGKKYEKPLHEELSFDEYDKEEYGIISCGPSIWRKDDLIPLCKKYISAFLFEAYGVKIAKRLKKKVFSLAGVGDVFSYGRDMGGSIHKGKWVGKVIRPINEKYDLDIDLDIRGVVENWRLEGEGSYYKVKFLDKIKNRYVLVRIVLGV